MNPVKTGVYKHYKNNEYRVISEATHSETEEPVVVYQALYGDKAMWVRPKNIFLETVEYEGETIPRFLFISES